MQNERIKLGFNLLAPFYDFLSKLFFGNYLFKSQIYFLPDLRKCNHILIFGGGTGKILAELLKLNVGAEYTYVDISSKMLNKAKQLINHQYFHQVNFICGSYTDIPSDKKFDIIITPYVLDCFSDKGLSKAMEALHEISKKESFWLFTDFHLPPNGSMKILFKIIIRSLYSFLNLFCKLNVTHLPDFDGKFSRLNYVVEKEKYFLKKLVVTRIYMRQE